MASAPNAIQPGTPPPDLPSLDDFYVPAYRVWLKGKENPQLVPDIVSVTFHDSLTDIDSVDLVVNNCDPGEPVQGQAVQGKFRYHNSNLFDPWQEIQVDMGYYRQRNAQLKQMLLGEISSMAPNFPASGGSTLSVRGLSLMHQFRTEQKTKQFRKQTDSEIAQQIVKDIDKDLKKKIKNINIQIPQKEEDENSVNEIRHEYLEMHHQYPIIFLLQRAREVGYDIAVVDEVDSKKNVRNVTFHYRSSASVTRPTYVLEWGKNLISFQPTLQTARQVNAVTVNGWNVQTKKPISETATRADLVKQNQKVIAPEDVGVTENQLSQKVEIIVDRGFKNSQDAKETALKTLRQLAQGLVTGKGKTIGLPELRAGCKVIVCMSPLDVPQGSSPSPVRPSDRFSGTYQVTETTHTISESGYTTDFSCRMEARIGS